MKKIGIITFHDTTNFGSWIQTYALYHYLEQKGCNVEIIDYQCREIQRREKVSINTLLYAFKSLDFSKINWYMQKQKKQRAFAYFLKRYMRVSSRYTSENIDDANKRYDIFLVGSDLVWDYRITNSDDAFFLSFANDDKILCSYASSTGFEVYDDQEDELLKKYLHRFKRITVREVFDVDNLKKNYNIIAQNVCDPSMLLTYSDWAKFITQNQHGEYVLLYFFDTDGKLRDEAKRYALKNKCKILIIGENDMNKECGVQSVFPVDIKEFITLIYNAKKIFTASYHGMMMSLIFRKQFCYAEAEPESRMKSIALIMNIQRFNVSSPEFCSEANIDYKEVQEIIKKYSGESKAILKEIMEWM